MEPATTPSATSTRPVALVTGASTGIGLELARVFVEHAFDVVVVAEEDAIHDAASELGGAAGTVTAVQADLATPEGVQAAWHEMADLGRRPAVVALNAGIGVSGGFDQTSLEEDLTLVACAPPCTWPSSPAGRWSLPARGASW
jgi:uncharacterized protein